MKEVTRAKKKPIVNARRVDTTKRRGSDTHKPAKNIVITSLVIYVIQNPDVIMKNHVDYIHEMNRNMTMS